MSRPFSTRSGHFVALDSTTTNCCCDPPSRPLHRHATPRFTWSPVQGCCHGTPPKLEPGGDPRPHSWILAKICGTSSASGFTEPAKEALCHTVMKYSRTCSARRYDWFRIPLAGRCRLVGVNRVLSGCSGSRGRLHSLMARLSSKSPGERCVLRSPRAPLKGRGEAAFKAEAWRSSVGAVACSHSRRRAKRSWVR